MKYQRNLAAAAVLAACLALTACGSSEAETPEGAAEGDDKVIEITDQPGSIDDYVGALEDVELETCATGGSLGVAGTVTNPESEAQNYRIFVSAMSADDTVGLVQVNVDDVAGGETAQWDTQMDLNQEDLDCVLRVERFPSE